MKIKITSYTKPERKETEIDVGRRGDFVLIKGKGRKNYTFGKLDYVSYVDKTRRYSYSAKDYKDECIKFLGESYILRNNTFFGLNHPQFVKRDDSYNDVNYFSTRNIEEVVFGLDNIISFLEKNPRARRFRDHANALRALRQKNETTK